MNRSILIVICDFLLLSLLTFSTDLSKMAGENEGSAVAVKAEVLPKATDTGGNDLAAVMKQALGEEQKNREQLQAELARIREAVRQQQAQLQQKQSNLEQQYASAQASVQALNQKLQSSAAETTLTREQLAAKEAEIQKQTDLSAALRTQLAQLAKSNQEALAREQHLAGQLQLAEVEKRAAADQVALMQQQVQAEHAENVKLAEGFKTLATNSGALSREIRENRALAPNAIFSEFVTNRIQTSFVAARTGLFGIDLGRNKTTETVLVTDGTNTFALCHVQDTPLTLWDPGTDWEGLTGTLGHNTAQVHIHALSFDLRDPRVVFMPVTPAEADQLGCKIYPISSDPYKFQDAVLVGAQEGYYGQCSFQMDLDTPQYVKLDRNLLKGLFGKFNPSRGDLVLSRNGELLGIMANNTYCLMLHDFTAVATIRFGLDVRAQHTGETLSRLFDYVFRLPTRLQ
jgi:murein DD-endopeptidase MepM/ murein hydrolase activator NlpD